MSSKSKVNKIDKNADTLQNTNDIAKLVLQTGKKLGQEKETKKKLIPKVRNTASKKMGKSDETSSGRDNNFQEMLSNDFDNEISSACGMSTERTNIPLRKKGSLMPNISKNKLIPKYNIKLKQLVTMKKDLLEKQKPMVELYKTVLSLRKQIMEVEGKEYPVEKIKILSNPQEDQFHQSKGDTEENVDTGNETEILKTKIQNILNFFMELCRQLTDEKCKIFDKLFHEDGEMTEQEIMQKINQCRSELNQLDRHADNELKKAENAVQMLLDDTQLLMLYGASNVETAQDLESKVQSSERRLKEALAYLDAHKGNRKVQNDRVLAKENDVKELNIQLQELHKIVQEEKALVTQFKGRQMWYEKRLHQMKDEVRTARLKKQEVESKVGQLNNYVKKMESEWRKKESELQISYNELQKAFAMQELYISKIQAHGQATNAKLFFNISLHLLYDILYPDFYFVYH